MPVVTLAQVVKLEGPDHPAGSDVRPLVIARLVIGLLSLEVNVSVTVTGAAPAVVETVPLGDCVTVALLLVP